ncbi:8-hydroxygeraniol oxidoreductase [Pyrus x bretschneideri]|uniref:8-hydroxygeraniol oxidoreductase n=1 Tax=Pyrus x bretschneideri TaxID=225117 RepID=UPI000510F8D5|nr:8-hydroxygeraniol oxidoreductase [Pyrus x bretschneideri]XP_048426999.1 8-hydroxygeraniol oxidoreductase [Pyrus x bretschneideri]
MSSISERSRTSQVITCKAVVCWGVGEAWKVEEIEVEPPKRSEVRVKMLYASFCHTDILISKGHPIPLFPRVLGHEGVGVVESIGEDVRNINGGDVVIPTFVSECEECENCVSGKTNMCLKNPLSFSGLMPDGTSRMSVAGQKLYHLFSCSTLSEYMVVNVNYLLKLPGISTTSPSLPHASFLSCGFSTGFGAPWKEAKLEKGSTVAVVGLGAVGLGAVEGARAQGAARIIGIDKNERKRGKGEAFGMTDFINPDDDDDRKSVSELIKHSTAGMGVDYCFECTGFAPFINEALEATKLGTGTAIVIGTSTATSVQINSLPLLCGRTLKGSIFGGLKPKTDLPVIIDKWMNKDMQLDKLLTHEVPLLDINQALELLRHPDCVKVLIKI